MIPTAHIGATSADEIANTVLMPGDPLRAKFIADTFLEDVTQFNNVRGMLGFTGYYKGKRVSVMGSGMGIPSALIYYHELYNFYGVETIIRIGTCGGFQDKTNLRDIIVATAAHTSSSLMKGKFGEIQFAPTPTFELLLEAKKYEDEHKDITCHFGSVLCSDEFYNQTSPDIAKNLKQYGVLALEMESAALFMTALAAGKKSLAIFTVSDKPGEEETAEQRETGYTNMMNMALEIAPE